MFHPPYHPLYHVNRHLSVYDLVERTREHKTMLAQHRVMSLISHEIERAILHDHLHARMFVGFERMSSFVKQVDTYQQLALEAESVWVFAHFDVPPPLVSNVQFFPLPANAKMAREWFLIVEAKDFFTALVAAEITPFDLPIDQRMFEGVWSFDEGMVTILQSWLSNLVRARTYDGRFSNRDYRKHAHIMAGIVSRLTERLTESLSETASAGKLQIAPSDPIAEITEVGVQSSPPSTPSIPILSDGHAPAHKDGHTPTHVADGNGSAMSNTNVPAPSDLRSISAVWVTLDEMLKAKAGIHLHDRDGVSDGGSPASQNDASASKDGAQSERNGRTAADDLPETAELRLPPAEDDPQRAANL